MAIFKKSFTKPLPGGAEVFVHGGQRLARWVDRHGRKRTARITTGRDGTERVLLVTTTHTVRFRDAGGVVRQVSSRCRSKDAARAIQSDLCHRVELVRAGVLSAEEEAVAAHSSTRITVHVENYIRHVALRACPEHVGNTTRLLKRVVDECGFQRLSDMQASPLENWLTLRRSEGMGARTLNTYRDSISSFAAWCIANNRLTNNPFVKVPKADAKAGCRRRRRAMSEDEIGRLLKVAQLRPLAEYGRRTEKANLDHAPAKRSNWIRCPLSFEGIEDAADRGRLALSESPGYSRMLKQRGRERALIYKMLILTGLRRGELASLTVGQVVLEGDAPHLVLDAADEKNRKGATIPLRKDLAADVRSFLRERPTDLRLPTASGPRASDKLFDVPRSLVRVLDRDMAAAGIPKVDDRGRVLDVHALRTTFGTLLSRAGVSLRTAQAVMRHSDPRLTANVYTDPVLLDVAGAVQALPTIPLDTGTGNGTLNNQAGDAVNAVAKPA